MPIEVLSHTYELMETNPTPRCLTAARPVCTIGNRPGLGDVQRSFFPQKLEFR